MTCRHMTRICTVWQGKGGSEVNGTLVFPQFVVESAEQVSEEIRSIKDPLERMVWTSALLHHTMLRFGWSLITTKDFIYLPSIIVGIKQIRNSGRYMKDWKIL